MDISEKQALWREQKPLFEAEFIHSQLLPSFNFNENTGDYEIKSQCLNNIDDVDRKVAYETLNTGWVMWLRAKCDAKAQAVPEGFVLVEKELSWVKADHLACAEWEKNKALFCTENRDMTAFQINEYRLRWCKNKAHKIMSEYKAMIETQEPANDSR